MNLVIWERKQAAKRAGSMAAVAARPHADSGEASLLPLQVNGRGGKGEGVGSITAALKGNGVG